MAKDNKLLNILGIGILALAPSIIGCEQPSYIKPNYSSISAPNFSSYPLIDKPL